MDQRPRFGRMTSEKLNRKNARHFADKVNTFARYAKTPEEKLELKKVRTEHKNSLKVHYGSAYHSRIHNLPDNQYQIN
jgi:hypothetical protein